MNAEDVCRRRLHKRASFLDRETGLFQSLGMARSGPRRATYEDLLAIPDTLVAEIIGGELITHPRPAAPHARAASMLGGELVGPFDRGKGGPGGWVLLDEPELHLHGTFWCPTRRGGDESGCRAFRWRQRPSNLHPTGCAKCFRRRPRPLIGRIRFPSSHAANFARISVAPSAQHC